MFSRENKGYRFTKEKCPFNIVFQKMSLEIEDLAQRLVKFSWSQSWTSSIVQVLSTDDKVWIKGTETSLLFIFYILNIKTFWDILEIGLLIGKLILSAIIKRCNAKHKLTLNDLEEFFVKCARIFTNTQKIVAFSSSLLTLIVNMIKFFINCYPSGDLNPWILI